MTDHAGAEPIREGVLDLYSITVEMADRVSGRRATANTFFFTVQAGLAVSLGAFALNDADSEASDPFLLFLAAVSGFLISASWWLLLRSYRDLNRAKYQVILDIEDKYLPLTPFGDEWAVLKQDPVRGWRDRYAEQGQVESVVPLVFVGLYSVLMIYVWVA